MRQSLITNFFAPANPMRTVGHTLEQNPPPNYIRHHAVVYNDDDVEFWAEMPAVPGHRLGELELYQDNSGDFWLNHIDVLPQYQRMGVATRLMRAAIADKHHLYASNSPYDVGGNGDTRHLSTEGAALVNALIASGAMQAGWLRPPVI